MADAQDKVSHVAMGYKRLLVWISDYETWLLWFWPNCFNFLQQKPVKIEHKTPEKHYHMLFGCLFYNFEQFLS